MRGISVLVIGSFALFVTIPVRTVCGQYTEEATVQQATLVLNEAMSTPGHSIPQSMLADCHGVAIIPNVIKGGFVVGARHGRGLLFVRDADGTWHAPVFITLTGGNIGWQIGVQSSDILLVFKTSRSIQGILSGKLTLGADAAAAAGPVGRQAAAATDGQLGAEIYTYSRSRGLFAGVSIDGSVIRMDQFATSAYYNRGPNQTVVVPDSALQLTQTISGYAGAAANPGLNPGQSVVPGQPLAAGGAAMTSQRTAILQSHSSSESDVLRSQLTQLAPELYDLLDPQWKNYLALPSSLFLGGPHPTSAEMQTALQNFDSVARNPQYQSLTMRPEFQSVYGVLKHYEHSLTESSSSLELPPPPASRTAVIP